MVTRYNYTEKVQRGLYLYYKNGIKILKKNTVQVSLLAAISRSVVKIRVGVVNRELKGENCLPLQFSDHSIFVRGGSVLVK